jgi:hypothetical protein
MNCPRISLSLFGEKARTIESQVGLQIVGQETDMNTKVGFKKHPAGRLELTIEM